MRLLLTACVLLTVTATQALAVEYTILRYKKNGFCEIVLDVPRWGDHFEALGAYNSRFEAERALATFRKKEGCPATKSSRRLETNDKPKKPSITHRPEREEPQGIFIR